MRRVLIATILVLPSCARAPEAPVSPSPAPVAALPSESYRLATESRTMMTVRGKQVNIESDIELLYAWLGTSREKTLKSDGLTIRYVIDGRVQAHNVMSRDGAWHVRDGKRVLEDLTPDQIDRRQELFDTPICKIRLDEHGAETGREIIESKYSDMHRSDGLFEIAVLFLAPFYADRDRWQANRAIPMGNGGKADGELTYEKISTVVGDLVTVRVSGVLGAVAFAGQMGVVGRNALFVVKGEQVYDAKSRTWESGALVIDGSFEVVEPGNVVTTSAFKMNASINRLPPAAAK